MVIYLANGVAVLNIEPHQIIDIFLQLGEWKIKIKSESGEVQKMNIASWQAKELKKQLY